MTYEVSYSQLESRIDAEFYQPEYITVMDELRKYPNLENLGALCKTIKSFGAYSLCNLVHYEQSGIHFIRVENLKANEIDLTDVKYISKITHRILHKSKVTEAMVLLSMAGTLGIAATVPSGFMECNSNQDIAKLVISERIDPYYLSTFLNCKYGRNQVLRLATGSTRRHILLYAVSDIIIPVPSMEKQKSVAAKIILANKMQDQARRLYSQTERQFYDILSVDSSKFQSKEVFETVSSDVFDAMRFDAEYHRPSLQRYVLKALKETGFSLKKLAELAEFPRRLTDPRKDPHKKIRYVELANVDPSTGEIRGVSEIAGHEAPSRAKLVLKKGDILVPSLLGSLDNVSLVPDELDGAIGSSGFFVVRSKTLQEGFLFMLFRSRLMKEQLEQKVAGSIMAAASSKDLENLLVPVPSDEQQREISCQITEYFRLRREATHLLEISNHTVEDWIESRQV